LTFNANYAWSDATDTVPTGGVLQLDLTNDPSILNPQDPYTIRRYNCGNADQDVRHYASVTWVYSDVLRFGGRKRGPERILGGWTLSGNVFYRTGLPFTVIDST